MWPDAVLLDMDGTLVETEPYWVRAEEELVAAHGGTWSEEHGLNLVGNNLLDSGRYIREHGGVDLEPSEIVSELLKRVTELIADAVPWRPGALDLLETLRAAGIPTALVTMSYRQFVGTMLAQLPAETFAAIVTGDAVSQGKPHPEPYLAAARELRVDPERCLAIEDSNTGTRSAESAGCTVLVVPNHVPVLPGPRRVFRDSLFGLGLEELAGLRR